MIDVAKLFEERKFPKWFSTHPVFSEIKQIKKVFPGIGLENCEGQTGVGDLAVVHASAITLIADLKEKLSSRINGLSNFVNARPDMAVARRDHAAKCSALMADVLDAINKDPNAFVQVQNNRTTLKLPLNIVHNKRQVFRQNESLFRVFNKLNDALHEHKFASMGRVENLDSFKAFSADNIPNNDYKIVFSADGADGAWDIATMSMRGIESCQSWDGEYRYCTIGSVIDPFVGIIYLTSGSNQKYGTKMIRRSIVRFVVNEETRKPFILIDYMYPSLDNRVLEQFKTFLKTKANGKFEIKYAPNLDGKALKSTYIPLNDIRTKLRSFSEDGKYEPTDDLESIQSYQDVRIESRAGGKDKHQKLFEKNSRKKERKFVENFVAAMQDAVANTNIGNVPDALQPALKKFKGNKDKYNHPIKSIATAIANTILANIDKRNYFNSNLYIKRVYASYFAQKSKILDDVKAKLTKEINGQLKLKTKMKATDFVQMMKLLSIVMDASLKKVFDEYTKPKKVKPLPLP
jgi:hypothetical protein